MKDADVCAMWYGVTELATTNAGELFGYKGRNAILDFKSGLLEANWVLGYTRDGSNFLLLGLDTLFSSEKFESQLTESLAAHGLPRVQISCVASHTHYAPALDPSKPKLGSCDDEYVAMVAERIADDVANARKSQQSKTPKVWNFCAASTSASVHRRAKRLSVLLRDRRISYGVQNAPNHRTQIDRLIRIWIAEDSSGVPLFVFMTWPCHATSRSRPDNLSADFIGTLRTTVREFLGCAIPVLYFPGMSGDIRPDFSGLKFGKSLFYPHPMQVGFNVPTAKEEQRFDQHLVDAAMTALSKRPKSRPFGQVLVQSLEVPVSRILQGADPSVMLRMQHLFLGGLNIFGVGAEVTSSWSRHFGLFGTEETLIVSGCVGPVFGYLPTNEQISEGGYEVDGFRSSFGLKGCYTTSIDVDTVLSQTAEVLVGSHTKKWKNGCF